MNRIFVKILFIFSIILGLSVCSKKKLYFFPFEKQNRWVYELDGYSSHLKKNNPTDLKAELSDSMDTSIFMIANLSSEPIIDTLDIYIKEIVNLSDDSLLYVFNFDFVRFWGNQWLLTKDGYSIYSKT